MAEYCRPRQPELLRKQDGRVVAFDLEKIVRAIHAAGQVSAELDADHARLMARMVLARLMDREALTVDEVQAVVERELMEAGCYGTARACIVHREQRKSSQGRALGAST
ncbi:MAG: anaerobic ribonucleoside triphosphate reductase [Moraxellaceae bacterium]|nr:anaerobic ribonucleoside triphosphate reductase [Moraxellaceae bacterium]